MPGIKQRNGAVNSAKSASATHDRVGHCINAHVIFRWHGALTWPKLWGKVDGVLCKSTWCRSQMKSAKIMLFPSLPYVPGLLVSVYFSACLEPLQISYVTLLQPLSRSQKAPIRLTSIRLFPPKWWVMAWHGSIVRYRRQTPQFPRLRMGRRGGTYHQREWVSETLVRACWASNRLTINAASLAERRECCGDWDICDDAWQKVWKRRGHIVAPINSYAATIMRG